MCNIFSQASICSKDRYLNFISNDVDVINNYIVPEWYSLSANSCSINVIQKSDNIVNSNDKLCC